MLFLMNGCTINSNQNSKVNSSSQTKKEITFSSNCASCSDCVLISNDIEPNKKFGKLLGSYFYGKMIGGYDCNFTQQEIQELFLRESYTKAIINLYQDPSNFLRQNPYEEESRWLDTRRAVSYTHLTLPTILLV